ncbi:MULTISPECIES: RNA polymerase sigma factor [Cytobacillus]|uniref:RNA polymerase sigma factor n=1 Tax=Cytobacillus oceanisediminis 2691 TaxID=1196031 RepID=A0A160MCY1_9BACI|nr:MULTISPECIES: RNA polymerase sigma factor [Cytobacillus]MBY0155050.1 RNA polymerase sigma factor [Cytobacillus firmus]AND40846.1 RNA polymerase subunit sigma-70 [Cytobacillus oceanisediminis 2691]MBU8729513.1 RNA polymerase sigma factor [Cytobacillus oceanisediminis]MCM3245278.1 RNA polymerase sigma factor [Cytobacillus oceanisediminis]MCM3393342.1 RNA polymerase sigma factor [Cytobacillus oceanisediminis]
MDITELYTCHYKRLYHICFSMTRDAYLAEDIVQETFIKAMKKAETIIDEEKAGAWLSVIARRTALDAIRRERRKAAVPMEQDMLECLGVATKQNVEQEVESGFAAEEITGAVKKLTGSYRDILLLKIDRGLKEREIAAMLNLNPSTVKTRIFRARKQLKMMVKMGA